jgi:hypothetical protein
MNRGDTEKRPQLQSIANQDLMITAGAKVISETISRIVGISRCRFLRQSFIGSSAKGSRLVQCRNR